jgi:hypothetical protein
VLVSSQNGGQNNYMSAETAQATLDEKMKDTVWAAKFAQGDAQCVKEFNNLTTLIATAKRAQ